MTFASRNLKLAFLVPLWLLAAVLVRAQKPLLRHYSTDQGLANTETYHVFQDSKGYIWISTTNGVTRFDGYTFQNFDEQDGLSDGTIFEAAEDSKGRIWFIGYNCSLSYYENGKIYQYAHNKAIRRLMPNLAVSVKSSFYIDKKDNIYFSIRYWGLIKLSPDGNITRLEKLSNNVADILQQDQKILVAQHFGISYSLNVNTHDVHTSFTDNALSKAANLLVFAVAASDHQSIFVACDHYVLQIFKNGKYLMRDMGSRVNWLSMDSENHLWVCPFSEGAIALNEKDLMGPIIHQYLSNKSVSSVMRDKEGGFWMSTLDDGVYFLPTHNTLSWVYPDNLPDEQIFCLETVKNKIFLGTGNGYLSVIENKKIRNIPVDTIHHSEIRTLAWDAAREELLIATTYDIYTFKNGKVTPLFNFKNRYNKRYDGSTINIKTIEHDKGSKYWLGNNTGLSYVDVAQRRILFNSKRDRLSQIIRINTLYRHPDGKLLIGTTEGIQLYNHETLTTAQDFISGFHGRILKITGDSLGQNIWISTKGNGLFLKSKGRVFHFTRKEGLLNNTPNNLYLNKNELWVASSQGVTCISVQCTNPLIYTIHQYTVEDGLASNMVFQVRPLGNKILIATNNGLSVLDRGASSSTCSLIPLYLNKVRLMTKDTLLPENAVLPYYQNSITFSYVGLSFQSLSKIQYQYRLLGLDSQWHTTLETKLDFPFLPPNHYELQIRTISDEGVITSRPIIQRFTITTPFWKTIWFIIFALLSLVTLGYLFYRDRVKRIEHDNTITQEINQYRQQALSKQMNPHFVFNSLNSIQYYIVKNDRVASSRYLSKFATLMRVILNNSQSQAISLADELDALKHYMDLEIMRFKERFDYIIEVDPRINQGSTLVPPFIIQPFIENSIWHGLMNRDENGLLSIRFVNEESLLRCIVEDNGVGRQKAAELEGQQKFGRQSKGIEITETRLKLYGMERIPEKPIIYTDLYDQFGVPEGTRVEILIPII